MNRRYSILILCSTVLASYGGAHWVSERIDGVVLMIGEDSLTVKTSGGKAVEATFDQKTIYTRGAEPIRNMEIKVGDRVLIRARLVKQKVVAETVQVRTSAR